MENTNYLILSIITLILLIVLIIGNILLLKHAREQMKMEDAFDYLRESIAKNERESRTELISSTQQSFSTFGNLISSNQQHTTQMQLQQFSQFEDTLHNYEIRNERKMEEMRQTMENRLSEIRSDNEKKLEQIRETVDEKLQKTLDERMSQSFKEMAENLERMYTSLGEMQKLAGDVSDLKNVLSNVKTKGILGEVQLKAILDEILAREQYEENVEVVPNSNQRVEFAIKLPKDDHPVYLPIDSKFPLEPYQQLLDAYEKNDPAEIAAAYKVLEARIKVEAKSIHDKYIEVPYTTDFAILFLPFEGLYSEAVNRGLVEVLQREYHINIAGPSTMAALLNSLQMGFKTLAIEKRSSEVWQVLGSVKSEFDKFADSLAIAQQKLNQANKQLDELAGVRTRAIQRKLKDVQRLEDKPSKEELADIY